MWFHLRSSARTSTVRQFLEIDGRPVEIAVRFSTRARRMSVKVHPASGEVSVVAPARRTLESALAFARTESDWIAAQLDRLPVRVVLTPGACVPLRGEDFRIVASAEKHLAVRADYTQREIRVGGRPEFAARRVVDFLKAEARRDCEAALTDFAQQLGVRARRITLRDPTSRWGSCSSSRGLSFSWRLVMAPPFVLTYVVAHETAHLREMNHSPRFWRLVTELVGDIKTPEGWLHHYGSALHRFTAE